MYLVVSIAEEQPRDLAERLFDLLRIGKANRKVIREYFGMRSGSLVARVASTHRDPADAVENVIDIVAKGVEFFLLQSKVRIFAKELESKGWIEIYVWDRLTHVVVHHSKTIKFDPNELLPGPLQLDKIKIADETRVLWVEQRRAELIESVLLPETPTMQ